MNSNGKGVTNTSLILYNISEVKESENKEKKGQFDSNKTIKSKKKEKKKEGAVKEPKDRKMVEFYLNQSFLRTQEKKDIQLWRVNPSCIS